MLITSSLNLSCKWTPTLQVHAFSLSPHYPTTIDHLYCWRNEPPNIPDESTFCCFPIFTPSEILHSLQSKVQSWIIAWDGGSAHLSSCFQPMHIGQFSSHHKILEIFNPYHCSCLNASPFTVSSAWNTFLPPLSFLPSLFWHHLLRDAFLCSTELVTCPSSPQHPVQTSDGLTIVHGNWFVWQSPILYLNFLKMKS